jgi:hypothetical protein
MAEMHDPGRDATTDAAEVDRSRANGDGERPATSPGRPLAALAIGFAAATIGYWIGPTSLCSPGDTWCPLYWWLIPSQVVVLVGGVVAALVGPSLLRVAAGLAGMLVGVAVGPVLAFPLAGSGSSPLWGTPPTLDYDSLSFWFGPLAIAGCVVFAIGYLVGVGIWALGHRGPPDDGQAGRVPE